jgi:hypothetical protein
VPSSTGVSVRALLDACTERGVEGIVAKRIDSASGAGKGATWGVPHDVVMRRSLVDGASADA